MQQRETTVKQRLIDFIKYKGLSIRAFEKLIGVSNAFVNNISKGIGADKMQRIISTFPDLDMDWLMTGEGSMLKGNISTVSGSNNTSVAGDGNQVNSSLTLDKALNENSEMRKLLERALNESSEMRKLLEKAIQNNKEQADSFFAIIGNLTK